MFQSIAFTHQYHNNDNFIDIGHLVECMIFYQKVKVLADENILMSLLRHFTIDGVVALIENDYLEIIYLETLLCTLTTSNTPNKYDFGFGSAKEKALGKIIGKYILETKGRTGKITKEADKIASKMISTKHDNIILEASREKVLNQDYITQSAKNIIKSFVPEFDVSDILFQTEKSDKMIRISDNIDYTKLNEIYHRKISPSHSSITQATIFSHLSGVESDLYYASYYGAELATSKLYSDLIQQNINYILHKTSQSQNNINAFQEMALKNKTIRECYNNGLISFVDLLKLLDKSKKFKGWLQGQSQDSVLLQEYLSSFNEENIIDKLPSKIIRFGAFTALGFMVNPVAGIALGVFDSFLLDKIMQGWKPSHFINDMNKILTEK